MTYYQQFLEIIKEQKKLNNLFLHTCCGPCSTSVLKLLNEVFNIYIIFYNPNIDTKDEFDKRLLQLEKVININNYDIKIIYNDYNHNEYLNYVKGLEAYEEGSLRCAKCFELRLKHSIDFAIKYIEDNNLYGIKNYITTTLTISPHKNSTLINDIGISLTKDKKIVYLPSDFKKADGYLNSIKLSKIYELYRQNYCGCEFSKK